MTAGAAPYVGARPFGAADRMLFFGRTRECRRLSVAWRRHRLTILHGGTGVGKTSLLSATLLPTLRETAAHVPPAADPAFRSAFPVAAVPDRNPYTFALLSSWSPGESPTRFAGLSITDFVRRLLRGEAARASELLLAVDRAEHLFLASETYEQERRRCLDQLGDALAEHPRVRLLLSVREDRLAETLRFARGLGDAETFPLGPFEREAALQAVGGPLGIGGGRDGEMEAVERIVDDLRTIERPDGGTERTAVLEPALLQTVCARLWSERPADAPESSWRFDHDIDHALAAHCAETLMTIAADHRLGPGELAAWFQDTFVTPAGRGQDVPEEGAGATRFGGAVLRAVEDHHLVRTWRRPCGARVLRLLHPRMIGAVRQIRLVAQPHRIGEQPGRTDPRTRLRAAGVCLASGDLVMAQRQAEAAARAAGDSTPMNAEAESVLGNIAYEQGRTDSAAEHYRRAAELYEVLQDTTAVGLLYAATGRLRLLQDEGAGGAGGSGDPGGVGGVGGAAGAAVADLSAATERVPNDLTVQTGLGRALWRAGRTGAALAVLDGVLNRNGDNPEALRARGEILADRGDPPSAEAALRDLSRLGRAAGPSARAAHALALALVRRFDAAARAELDDLVAHASDNGPVLYRAACVEHLQGARETAMALAARAVEAKDPPLPSHQRTAATRLQDEL